MINGIYDTKSVIEEENNMATKNVFRWTTIYEKIADGLLKYRDNRERLLSGIKKIYSEIDLDYPFVYHGNDLVDICPFTIFGMFNRGITDEHRAEIIKKLMDFLEIYDSAPDSFDGIPTFNNMNAWLCGDDKKDVEEDWKLFEMALDYADKTNEETELAFQKSYDQVRKRVKGYRLTICLFWIRPDFYLSLDNVMRNFLKKTNFANINNTNSCHIFSEIPSSSLYIETMKLIKNEIKIGESEHDSIVQLSNAAWQDGKSAKRRTWIVPSNPKYYDANLAFSENKMIDWRQRVNYSVDDIVFIYLAKPMSKIMYKCEVKKVDIAYEDKINDEKYYLKKAEEDHDSKDKYARFKLVEKVDDDNLSLDMLTKHGLNNAPQSPKYISNKLSKYINQFFAKEDDKIRYWSYAPGENASNWDSNYEEGIMSIGWGHVGDITEYKDKKSIQNKLQESGEDDATYTNAVQALWQFAHEVKPGDIIIAKKGKKEIIGKGIVESAYYYDDSKEKYMHIRNVKWTNKGSWIVNGAFTIKTLTDITSYPDFVKEIETKLNSKDKSYTKEDFLGEVYLDDSAYETIKGLLLAKKNLILQGAPGVGKTYIAKRLVYSILGEMDDEKVNMIQFHQSYSYEDFIMGFRPVENGFKLENGPFYDFSKKAQADPENKYFLIIDEINRGDLSKIFGELLMLIECDKRGPDNKIRLLYNKNEDFYVPQNLYLIGMMNTADRSLAMIDYALRRRFAFCTIEPAFESEGFIKRMTEIDNEKFNNLVNRIKELNKEISADESLGKGFQIGHSYMCTDNEIDEIWLKTVIDYELIPLLNEYWFDEPKKVEKWEIALENSIK